MRRIITVAAAIAFAAGAAQAQGNGHGKDRGPALGGPGDHAAGPARPGEDRGKGTGRHEAGPGKGRDDRGNGPAPRDPRDQPTQANRGPGEMNRAFADDRGNRGRARDDVRTVVVDRRGPHRDVVVREVDRAADFRVIPAHALVVGCPPGLAKKRPPCVPPGHVRGPARHYDRPDFWGLRLDDGRYRYDDGYLVRLAPDGRIGGYVPLLGGALALGNAWPTYYQPVALPTYYESYYGLGPGDSYRYADNVIYQVDPQTDAITSVLALLTGDSFAVGQAMPAGYDIYNVPYRYRDQYYDTPESLYRYSDGYVYEVDPTTQLITAAIELIAS